MSRRVDDFSSSKSKTAPQEENQASPISWNEKWKELEFKAPATCEYAISNWGRIRSTHRKTGKVNYIKGGLLKRLNLRTFAVNLSDGSRFHLYVHKFVADNFVRKTAPDQDSIIHIDTNKQNNHYQNLKWATRKELYEFQKAIGRYDKNINRDKVNIKMTESKVIMLKKKLKRGKVKKSVLAREYDISLTQLKRIESGENWSHVTID